MIATQEPPLYRALTFLQSLAAKKTSRDAAIYVAGTFAVAAVPLILLPILTRYLSPADYGRVAIVQGLIALAVPFIGFSLHGAIIRFHVDSDRRTLAQYLSSCTGVSIAGLIGVLLIVLFFQDTMSAVSGVPTIWILMSVVAAFFGCQTVFVSTVLRAERRPISFCGFQFSQVAFNLALSLFLVVVAAGGWQGRASAIIAASIIWGLIAMVWMGTSYGSITLPRIEFIRDSLKFSVPALPHTLAALGMIYSDRFILVDLLGAGEMGAYVVAQHIAGFMLLFGNAIGFAWVPWVFQKLKDGSDVSARNIVHATYICFGALTAAAVSIIFVAELAMPWLVGAEFQSATTFIPWLVCAALFNSLYVIVSVYIFYEKKTYLLSVITPTCLVLKLAITYWLVPFLGATGAAIGSLVSMVMLLVLAWVIGQRSTRMPLHRGFRFGSA
ncbi:MAG: oligosaccharide flippase family protein [Alphaproteobacteria bacterium]|nr:oligosaccharide flippase family protein [Alphaproteobacteria bacterium]